MKTHFWLGCLLGAAGALQTFAQTNISARYKFVTMDYTGAAATYPLGINSRGDIAGYYVDTHAVPHGFVYKQGKFSAIAYPGAVATAAAGINDRGDVSGTYFDAQGFQHGYLMKTPDWCDGDEDDRWDRCKPTFQSIDFPGAAQTKGIEFEFGPGLGTAIASLNNRNEVAGLYATQALYSNGFVYSPRAGFSSVDAPGANHGAGNGTRLFGVNNLGVMVGDYVVQASAQAPPINYGFLLAGNRYKKVFVPGSEQGGFGTQVNSVNDFGIAVGIYSDAMGNGHGLVWWNERPYQLDYPGTIFTEAHVINNRGAITGAYAADLTGFPIHGFVATPLVW